MATIDNLNFNIILNDQDFNQRIQKDLKAAQDLNIALTSLLDLKKRLGTGFVNGKDVAAQERISKAAASAALSNEKLAQAAARTATEQKKLEQATSNAAIAQQRLQRESMKTEQAMRRQNTALSKQGLLSKQLLTYAARYVGIFGAARFLGSIVRVTGEFELQKTTLAAMLGDLSQAEQIMGKIKQLSVKSPFQFKELASYAKQLSAFSVPAEELFDTTKMLADVSAGLGVDMSRLVLAFGQVKAAAFLRGQEVRQFTEAGIPILAELAKQFEQVEKRAVSTGEVFERISARQVPFEMVLKVFKDLTSEGGKFFNMQDVQAETLRGKVSNLKDAWDIMLNDIGSQQDGLLKGGVDMLTKMMQHWEKIAVVLKTVIAGYGAYKAVLLAAWAVEKSIAIGRMIKYFALLTTRVNLATAAMRAFNMASKSNVLGVIIAAVVALTTAIGSAISASRKLKRELNEMIEFEFLNSQKSADGLTDLVDQLSKATHGTKEYSDIVAQINRQYGEYLPKMLDEADAYDKIAIAAENAKEAIRKKGIVSAQEAGYRRIEEDFLKDTNKYSKDDIIRGIQQSLYKTWGDMSRQQYAFNRKEAEDILDLTLKAIEDYPDIDKLTDAWKGNGSVTTVLEDVAKQYGELDEIVEGVTESTLLYLQAYAEMIERRKELDEQIEDKGDSEHYSQRERERINAIEEEYRAEKRRVNFTMAPQEAKIRLVELEEEKIYDLIDAYEELGRIDKANYYRARLPKDIEGWRKIVQDTITAQNLDKGTSFGLWAEDTTVSVDYVEDMVKRWKELKDQIDTIPFDTEQQNRLKKNKQLIEDIAKALGINLEELAKGKRGGSGDSPEEKRLKRLIDILRKLQDQYEKMKELGVTDTAIQNLFRSLYPDLIEEHGDEFVTNLNYLERAREYINQLSKLDPIDAEKLLFNLGKDKFGTFYDGLTKSTSAVEKYYKTIRKWRTEDFNLTGTGVNFDLDKIASDLTEKNSEIDLKVKELKDTLRNININDADHVKVVKQVFENNFGEGTWDAFYDEFLVKGKEAIDKLAQMEKNYERKSAQEKATGLASNYVKDATKHLSMTDWSDKSIYQITLIQNELMKLMSNEAILDDNVKQRLEALGISLEEFQKAVNDALTSDYNETITEKIKKIQEKAKEAISIFGEVGGALTDLGDAIGSDSISDIGKYLSVAEDVVMAIAECDALWNSITEGAKAATDATKEVAEGAGDIANSTDWITMIIKVVVIAVEQIANAVGATKEAQRQLNMAALEYAKIMNQINLDSADTIFGKDFRKTLEENFRNVRTTLNNLKKQYLNIAGNIFSDDEAKRPKLNTLHELSSYLGYGWFGTGAVSQNIDDYEGDFLKMMEDIKLKKQELLNATKGASGYKLDGKTKKAVEDILAYYDEYLAALEALRDTVRSMFGNLADDIASNMIDAFVRTKDAASDLGKVFENLGETILNSMISSMVLEDILSKYENQAMAIMESMSKEDNEEATTKLLIAFADSLKAELNDVAKFATELSAVFQENGLLRKGEDSQSLANGIKGITEDTANLLASYLNAIRADVSYSKTLWEQMDVSLRQIASMLVNVAAPSLMEYQMQIAANTYNTALHTQAIMEDLRSVITSEGGFTAIRTLS